MADITELLRLAGGEGSDGPDLAAVHDRAGALRRRDRVLRGTAVAAAVLVAVPLVQLRGGSDALEQLPAGPRPTAGATAPAAATTLAPTTAPPSGPGLEGVTPTASPSGGPATRQAVPPGATTAPPPLPGRDEQGGTTDSQGSDANAFPRQASCQVSANGLAPGATVSCRFTATARGGWYRTNESAVTRSNVSANDVQQVLVERAGRITRYDLREEQKACLDDAVRPGDRVTVTIRQRSADSGFISVDIGAGEGYDCNRRVLGAR